MMNRSVRVVSITIENFKNVKKGNISLENKRKDYKASIVGIYGQNGSGKTALIDAVDLLKYVLCGHKIPAKYADYVNIETDHAKLCYQFRMKYDEGIFDVWYQFCLKRAADDTEPNIQEDSASAVTRAEIFDEVLSYAFASPNEKCRKSSLIDVREGEVFVPRAKLVELVGEKADITDLLVIKKLVRATSRAFVFSWDMINIFRKNCKNERYMAVIEGLRTFGMTELFVVNTENTGLISMNTLPLAFKYKEKKAVTYGSLMLPLNASAQVPEQSMEIVRKVIDNMNIVLTQIVPGLTINIYDLGPAVFADGRPGRIVQLMSQKDGREIPFQYESEGIKKIVSILQLLIVVYNNPSITVAVDELDAGIFEYLLGEILNIISEKGKGQLIFTSHNLRPLETLDKGFIAFTTTNPENRYIRLTNVKENNNLRDFYYRDIVLGEQSEPVYQSTNNFEIALAFREAGEGFGS